VVYRLPTFFAMPGDSGGAPGYVQLQDTAGHVLDEAELEMVQNADQTAWHSGDVEIRLIAEWRLRR